jgi:hypothetical protein
LEKQTLKRRGRLRRSRVHGAGGCGPASRTALAIAYRYLDMDYEDGKGSRYFKYDVATSGPAMGVVFTF